MQEKSTAAAQIAESRQFVLAFADSTCYGLDIEAVIEILPFEQPTPIPDAPVNVMGVLDIRGGSVPIADLSACLGTKVPQQKDSRIIILALEDSRIGLVVESVAEVVTIQNSSFQTNQGTLSASRFVREVVQLEEFLVLTLDHQAVVDYGLDTPPAIHIVPDVEDAGESTTESPTEEGDDAEPETEDSGLNVALLESSFELVAPRAEELAEYFYNTLFERAPAVRELFPDDMAGQRKALIGGIATIVKSLRDGAALESFLSGLGERHVEYGALAEHYPVIGEVLLQSLAHIAGDAWTEELQSTWAAAYGAIQSTMISAGDGKSSETQAA